MAPGAASSLLLLRQLPRRPLPLLVSPPSSAAVRPPARCLTSSSLTSSRILSRRGACIVNSSRLPCRLSSIHHPSSSSTSAPPFSTSSGSGGGAAAAAASRSNSSSSSNNNNRLVGVLAVLAAGVALDDGTVLYWLADHVGMPAMRALLDAEQAHDLAIKAAASGLLPKNMARWGGSSEDEVLRVADLWGGVGLTFPSCVGIAAGFDKHGEAVEGLLGLGAGFVEVGSVTPLPQDGNPNPRMFRLVEDRGVINRYGFNSHGMQAVKARLQARLEKLQQEGEEVAKQQQQQRKRNQLGGGVMGVNAGKNKATEKAEDDYCKVAQELGYYADYLVINVSSPNTPGLRALQQAQAMKDIIKAVQNTHALDRNWAGRRVPLLVKVAPDLTPQDMDNIAQVVLSTGVDGLIVSNTTISRPETLKSVHRGEVGGLSGAPLKDLATETIRQLYRRTQGRVPIVGVGGVGSGQDAYDKIRAGASLVQVYSMLVYEGPGAIRRIKSDLAALLRRDGFKSVRDAVGVDTPLDLPPPTTATGAGAAAITTKQRRWWLLWLL